MPEVYAGPMASLVWLINVHPALGQLRSQSSSLLNTMTSSPVSPMSTVFEDPQTTCTKQKMYGLIQPPKQLMTNSTSARALTSDVVRQMADLNAEQGEGPEEPKKFCGEHARLAFHAILTLCFSCMLRLDEVLDLQESNFEFVSTKHIRLSVERKYHSLTCLEPQHPFELWLQPRQDAHICPLRALFAWLEASNYTSGYVFRRIAKTGCVSSNPRKHLSFSDCMEMFRYRLLDIGLDPQPYGKYSIMRGGFQFLVSERHWTIPMMCEWTGLPREHERTPYVVAKYLWSSNDLSAPKRDSYLLNPPGIAADDV